MDGSALDKRHARFQSWRARAAYRFASLDYPATDGLELFYRSPSGAVMRVPIPPLASSWKSGTSTQLFESSSYVFARTGQRSYDVAPDAKRFLMLKNRDTSAARITPPAHRGRPTLVRGTEAARGDEVIANFRLLRV